MKSEQEIRERLQDHKDSRDSAEKQGLEEVYRLFNAQVHELEWVLGDRRQDK